MSVEIRGIRCTKQTENTFLQQTETFPVSAVVYCCRGLAPAFIVEVLKCLLLTCTSLRGLTSPIEIFVAQMWGGFLFIFTRHTPNKAGLTAHVCFGPIG